jgi:hypothetical protein
MTTCETDVDGGEHSLPVDVLICALTEYFVDVGRPDVSDARIRRIAQRHSHRLKELARTLEDGFDRPFRYMHLLGLSVAAASKMPEAAVATDESDPRLRHPLCPPS